MKIVTEKIIKEALTVPLWENEIDRSILQAQRALSGRIMPINHKISVLSECG